MGADDRLLREALFAVAIGFVWLSRAGLGRSGRHR
jgi:hypothetical protein